MSNQRAFDQSHQYRIKLKGNLDDDWSEWFGRFTIYHQQNETILDGCVADQAELFGILNRIRDIGVVLLGVEYVQADMQADQEQLQKVVPDE